MASEARQTPNSNVTRRSAINIAEGKSTGMGILNFLTPGTKARLTSIHGLYNEAYLNAALKKNDLAESTVEKNGYVSQSRMMNSHFVQVFNLGVERGVYPATGRTFYMIDVASDSIPDMASEKDLLQVGLDLVTGDTIRVAAGGAAMANPSKAEVNTAYEALRDITVSHSTAKDAYDKGLEGLDALNAEADKVIKKVWDEVETHYNEEDASSQRDYAREWGVVYVLVGSNKKISGTVRDKVTGLPIEGARVSFERGNKTAITGADGKYELGTTLMGDQAITATGALHEDYSETITLVENEDKEWDILMVATA